MGLRRVSAAFRIGMRHNADGRVIELHAGVRRGPARRGAANGCICTRGIGSTKMRKSCRRSHDFGCREEATLSVQNQAAAHAA